MKTVTEGTIHIHTYKDGLLSGLGHDLQLCLKQFELSIDKQKVNGSFSTDTIEVEGALRNGQLDRYQLSQKDKRDIHDSMSRVVLQTARHPRARFIGNVEADDGTFVRITGTLELRGRSRPLMLSARRSEGQLEGSVTLLPSQWGIRPFKALLGALKLQDRVDVRFKVPEP